MILIGITAKMSDATCDLARPLSTHKVNKMNEERREYSNIQIDMTVHGVGVTHINCKIKGHEIKDLFDDFQFFKTFVFKVYTFSEFVENQFCTELF